MPEVVNTCIAGTPLQVEPPPAAEIKSVLPLGKIATFAPADNVTATFSPFRLLTTWPLAMLSLVIEPAVTLMAVEAVPAMLALDDQIAYGVGVNSWRGAKVVNVLTPLVAAQISSQLVAPVNATEPKSTSTVKRPLLTVTPLLVTGPAMAIPLLLVLNSEKVRL